MDVSISGFFLCVAASAMSWSLFQMSPIECVCCVCVRAWSKNLNNEATKASLGLLGHRRRKRIKVFVYHGRQITKFWSYIWNSRISIQGLGTTIRFVPSKIAFVSWMCFIVSTSVFPFPHASYSTKFLNSYLFVNLSYSNIQSFAQKFLFV